GLVVTRVRRCPPAPLRTGNQPLAHHRGRHSLLAGPVTTPSQLLLDARRPVFSSELSEDRRDQQVELLLPDRAPRRPAGTERVVTGAGEPKCTAHQRLRVVSLLRRDELEAHFPLLAKKAAAFRRKSRSIVIIRSSRRKRVTSARSSLVSG